MVSLHILLFKIFQFLAHIYFIIVVGISFRLRILDLVMNLDSIHLTGSFSLSLYSGLFIYWQGEGTRHKNEGI